MCNRLSILVVAMNIKIIIVFTVLLFQLPNLALEAQHALVFQSDFGNKDGAVPSMKGVAYSVSPDIKMFDLTHENSVFNIWEAAYRLNQTASYWPKGTVFVSVVDPGVGTERKSVVLKTKTGHYFVTPDNGSLTLVAESMGIAAVREIDEAVNRLKGSEKSYTFHGRDVYAYTGARLAAEVISFKEVGRLLHPSVESILYERAQLIDGSITGNIPILDVQFGNIWTNIERQKLLQLGLKPGDHAEVTIFHKRIQIYRKILPYVKSFGDVDIGESAIYINDLLNVSFAINQGDFAAKYHINSGAQWSVKILKQ